MHRRPARGTGVLPKGLAILYEDRDVLVVDKPPGLLTMGTDTDKTHTAYFLLTAYVRKGQDKSRKRLFIVHRLDRETSGVLLFAKSEDAKFRLQEQWPDTHKKYFAVVHGILAKTSDTIATYLAENRAHMVYSTADKTRGRWSRTSYKVLEQTKHFALLEVELLTGRKHQIRVHLSGIGHAVVGDKKYGKQEQVPSEWSRLALHAASISFRHPFHGEALTIESPLPASFRALLRVPDKR